MFVFRSSDSIWLLLVCVSVVSCQVITVSVGQDVLLPCIYSQVDKIPRTVNVYWRGKDDLNVYDVIANQPDVSRQASRFRDRIICFPDLYSKGNFSVVLKNVKQVDGGLYDCFIPLLSFRHHVNLTVSVNTQRASVPPPLPFPEGSEHPGGSVAVRLNHLSLLLILLFGQTFL